MSCFIHESPFSQEVSDMCESLSSPPSTASSSKDETEVLNELSESSTTNDVIEV